MAQCPICKYQIDDDSRYCEHCGVRLMACPDGHGFGAKKCCNKCGKKLVEAEPTLLGVKHPTHLTCPPYHIRLRISDGAIIGRSGSYAGVFDGFTTVSGHHARLDVGPTGEVSITDLSSTNGTFVNGNRLPPGVPQSLKVGDAVAFYELQFQVAE